MAERNPPVWMASGTYNAVDDRLVTGLMVDRDFTTAGATQGIAGGVVPPSDQLKVTADGSTLNVTVSSGVVVVPAFGANPPGAYVCYSDSNTTKTLDAAGSLPRIDSIYAEVKDTSAGDFTNQWSISVQKGTENSSPVSPTLTRTKIKLADVRVLPASQNGGQNKITQTQVTDLRQYYAAQGGVHLNFGGGTPLPPNVPGRLLYVTDKKSLYVSDGTTFDPVYTQKEWLSYYRSLKPRQDTAAGTATLSTKQVWHDSISPLRTIQVAGVSCPAGYATVDIGAHVRISDVAGTNQVHMSVRAFAPSRGGTLANQTLFAPTVVLAVSSYTSTWINAGTSFLIEGLPTDQLVTFRIEYYRDSTSTSSAQRAYVAHPHLVVTPGY